MSLATVLIPTHSHPQLLPWAIDSARRQTVTDIEIFIVCDGADLETIRLASAFEFDHRVHVFVNPKGQRHGEAWRAEALSKATSPFVAYLSDDDLWLTDHLKRMLAIGGAGLCHTLPAYIQADGVVSVFAGSREAMLAGSNHVPFSAMGHPLAAYRSLPEGWASAPPEVFTDLFMWLKFLKAGHSISFSKVPTVVHFPGSLRSHWQDGSRRSEIASWALRIIQDEAAVRRVLLEPVGGHP